MHEPTAIVRLIGVYDADHTLRGELSYWVGARFGTRHCSLCEITHGTFGPTKQWRACQSASAAPFDTFHRDDQPGATRALNEPYPFVAVETPAATIRLLTAADLAGCSGSLDAMNALIEAALADRNLTWPEPNSAPAA